MRKFFLCAALLGSALLSFSETPPLLRGIWQGSDRLVMFSGSGPSEPLSVVLRVFYGWYSDRAAEPARFSELAARARNDASAGSAEDVSVSCAVVYENPSRTAGVYELTVGYPAASSRGRIRREDTVVPVAVVDGKLYLDFLVKPAPDFVRTGPAGEGGRDGFWRAASNADGITVSPPRISGEVRSFFVSGGDVYRLRYWRSGMEYADSKATFSDGGRVFEVAKFLKIGAEVYQCAAGRGTKIRNIERLPSLPASSFDSDGTICVIGEPYLVRVPGKDGAGDLLSAVADSNVRRHEPPKPVFPPSNIDFHWKEIEEIEKMNPATWSRRNVDLGK